MKREIVTTSKYRKELKVALKSKNFDVKVLEDVVEKLRNLPSAFLFTNHHLRPELK